jgi:hypothetical protein
MRDLRRAENLEAKEDAINGFISVAPRFEDLQADGREARLATAPAQR